MNGQRTTRRYSEDLLVEYSQKISAYGFGSAYYQRLSTRFGDDRLLVTPKGFQALTREQLLVVDKQGQCLCGDGELFTTLPLHVQLYQENPDLRAIIQTSPPTATGLMAGGTQLLPLLLVDAVTYLGAKIPFIPWATWTNAHLNIAQVTENAKIIGLEQGGFLVLGKNLPEAFTLLEMLEHLAKVQLVAMQTGRCHTLSSHPLLTPHFELQEQVA